MAEHLTDEQLLLACDGEAGAVAESHLAVCAECEARLIEIKEASAWYAEFREQARHEYQPPPPRPWENLTFTTPRRRVPALYGWMAAAAAVLVAIVLWPGRKPQLPTVAELLSKAEASSRPSVKTRQVRMRTSRGVLIRPAVWIHRKGAEHPLQPLFQRAGYSWDEPLSVRSYDRWRRSLVSKKESVTRGRYPKTSEPVYVVKTETDTNPLREATLSLREQDLQPLGGTLRFADEVVEMDEAAEDDAPPTPSTQPAPAIAAQRETTSQQPAMRELEVLLALHRIGADLGEPIQITHEGGSVVVTASGVSAGRRTQLQSALSGLDHVELRFDSPQTAPPAATRRPAMSGPIANPVVRRLVEQRMEGRGFEEFVNDALDASDALLSRTHAIAALAARFPADVEQSLPTSGRQQLDSLRRDHVIAAAEQVQRLSNLLSSGLDINSSPASIAFDMWQRRGTALRDRSREFDTLLTGMLTGARTYDAAALQSAFGHMRSELESLAGSQ